MMKYEDYIRETRALEQQIRESKIEEGKAKSRAIEKCNQEHRRLRDEMCAGFHRADAARDEEINRIHSIHVEERCRLWERHSMLVSRFRKENGIAPPNVEQPSGERPNNGGSEQ